MKLKPNEVNSALHGPGMKVARTRHVTHNVSRLAGAWFPLCLIITLVICQASGLAVPGYLEGETAREDVRTPVALAVVDSAETARQRAEAGRKAPPIYRFLPEAVEQAAAASAWMGGVGPDVVARRARGTGAGLGLASAPAAPPAPTTALALLALRLGRRLGRHLRLV